jgi:hypothetical protein
MPTLILLGNIRQYTFANAIVAANCKSIELFGIPLTRIEVFHSKDSFHKLYALKIEGEANNKKSWADHLLEHNIQDEILVHRTADVTYTKQSVEDFINGLEGIVSNVTKKDDNLILDITNGTTISKNLLSTAAYLLDIPHQYMIDVSKLFSITEDREFISANLLKQCYTSAPESTDLDNIAYLNLAEVLRYKKIINDHSVKYKTISEGTIDTHFFETNLKKSVALKLDGDQRKDNTVYRIATASISTSIEDLITYLVERFAPETNANMMGEKLGAIRSLIESRAPDDFDIIFFRKLNDFILYLRNSTTHQGRQLTNIEKFKAELAVKMAFPFIAFYTDIVYDILSSNVEVAKPKKITELDDPMPPSDTLMYYGLDGDNTGQALEELFLHAKKEDHFRRISESIKKAIAGIRNKVKNKDGKNSIIFEAGDDLLFSGRFTKAELEEFRSIYNTGTSGMTCSIGYGKSFQEVYLAMKIAKTTPGKNTIVGAKLD